MAREIEINKVVITDEAKCDYESITGYLLNVDEMEAESRTYINLRQRSGGLLWERYFRVKYYDEWSDRMLMLFIYKGKKDGIVRLWEIKGICFEEDWSQELEDCGQIRVWLNSSLNPPDEGDWVWDLRIREEQRRKEVEEWLNDKD